jgi:hypothetical protein
MVGMPPFGRIKIEVFGGSVGFYVEFKFGVLVDVILVIFG